MQAIKCVVVGDGWVQIARARPPAILCYAVSLREGLWSDGHMKLYCDLPLKDPAILKPCQITTPQTPPIEQNACLYGAIKDCKMGIIIRGRDNLLLERIPGLFYKVLNPNSTPMDFLVYLLRVLHCYFDSPVSRGTTMLIVLFLWLCAVFRFAGLWVRLVCWSATLQMPFLASTSLPCKFWQVNRLAL